MAWKTSWLGEGLEGAWRGLGNLYTMIARHILWIDSICFAVALVYSSSVAFENLFSREINGRTIQKWEIDRSLIAGLLNGIINGSAVVDTCPGSLGAIGLHKPALILGRHQVCNTVNSLFLKDEVFCSLLYYASNSLLHRSHSKDARGSYGEAEELCYRGRSGSYYSRLAH
jgi:hypothetical protein